MKAMIDTNIVDKMVQDGKFAEALRAMVTKGSIQIFYTAIVRNQIQQVPDSKKREQLQDALECLKAEYIPVEFAPYGYVYGECYGGLSRDVILDREDFIRGNNKQIEDAIIAATASSQKYQLDYIVTEDTKFIKKMNRQGTHTKAINFEEFKNKIMEPSETLGQQHENGI